MPWIASAASAVGSIAPMLGGGGSQGPRNINFKNVNSDPWAVEQYGNANSALAQQQAFAQALGAQNGIGNQSNVFQQQQGLANTLGQQAAGQGPNPAQAQLAQNTSNNIQQQSALMGSQRGTSQNAGMLARQAAMQGAGIQQQGVGQAATLQAQQQLAAQQALMQQQAQMAQLSSQQVGQQANAQNAYQQGAQNLFGTQSQNIANWNSGQVTAATGASNNAAAMGLQQNAQENKMLGGLGQGIGSAMGVLSAPSKDSGLNNLGYENDFSKLADGGSVESGPKSRFGQYCTNMKSGGVVQGQAQVAGNSPKNDTVPAMLSPGESVIDRETLARNDKVGQAARFVTAYINKRNRK